jgi:hypothetical protein
LEAAAHQFTVALQVALGADQLRRVPRLVRLGLIQLCLIRARIDEEQSVILLHLLAGGKKACVTSPSTRLFTLTVVMACTVPTPCV